MAMLDDMIANQAAKLFGSGDALTLPKFSINCTVCVAARERLENPALGVVVMLAQTVALGTPVCHAHAAEMLEPFCVRSLGTP